MKIKNILIIVVLFALCSCNSSKKSNAEDKDTTDNSVHTIISTNKSIYIKDEAIELSLEVKNTGNKPYTFLPWGTPIENKFTGACLKVTHNNKNIDYTGIMVKRVSPTEKDYITLESGEIAVGKVNLLDGYHLDENGVYTIQFEERYNGLPESNTIKIEIK
ncbi:hypothetical protein [Leeuwenhoekiella marinoflava]|uniref:Uncharacterized protein n=2 Tax=Leeuwenhoekiella marinoflava TaxID=988 RepID=A0A4Q0PMQ9_9FLAO|nr:hypothetical protein [Leeuwenhoekiella marinoflava]RXG31826.1 hypothetical protein DSL99_1650 [Leeuwenhoekiella marinoflava]SHF03654.1 hypothetical protein SAMN02745246_01532 [Leeuwenhoekiella marinoflava DSM 3653]